jgi:peptide/nickel transport system substrate-binding protein
VGWFGWPDVPRIDELRSDWLNAATLEEQKKLAAEIQVQFFRDVTHVPLGQFFQPAAFHKKLAYIQPGWPVMHSVRMA